MRFSTLFTTSALALSASATPFALLALRSGGPLQFASINDNNLSLTALGPATTVTPPPSGISGAANTNTTVFNLNADGTVTMAIEGTGIQYLYVSLATGLAEITAAHTDFIPGPGVSNFTISHDGGVDLLNFEYGSAYACGKGPYNIFFGVPALVTENCLGIDLLVDYLPEGTVGAWEYA